MTKYPAVRISNSDMRSITNDDDTTLCPICGTGQMRFIYAKNHCDILRCEACGAGLTSVSEFDPAQYYTEAYFEGGYEDGYADYGRSEAVLRHEFARLAQTLRKVAPVGGPLLEIGCAYGFFLNEARRYWQVHGLEISADAVGRCHAAGLVMVRQGMASPESLDEIPPLQAIVMLDVIEHIEDPVGFLNACRTKLVPGGILMLTTGDFGSPLARLLGRSWRLMTPPQHLWFFTRPAFEALAQRQDWDVVRLAHPGKRVPFSLVIHQLRRMLHLKPRVPSGGARLAIPINLGDAMLLILRRPIEGMI